MTGFPSYYMFDFPRLAYILKMKRERQQPKRREADQHRSTSNQLAKRLYRNNSLTRLTPLGSSPSALASLNTSLIPSISLRKLAKLQVSQPSIEFSQGRILLRRSQDPSTLSQTCTLVKKKAQHRKFDKIDSITEKSIVPDDLKPAYEEEPRKFKPSKKWLAKLKQGKENLTEKLTPEDFMQLLEEQGGLGNEFCYLERGEHPYDLRIVQFGGAVGDEYITISARGVTYFNWEGSRFVGLAEWRREAALFRRLMGLEFFGKYKLHKNFTNWKKYARKVAMKKTTDKLKAELLVHDRHLRQALLSTRTLCCRMESQTNYCSLDDAQPALPFARFKAAQQNYLADRFQRRLGQLEEEIKGEVGRSLGVSMREFKEQNKISSGKEGKGLPLLIGDQKNLEMPYTKEATLRVQQEKFKRFLKLIELLVVHAKINMMDEATLATARKLTEQNDAYADHLVAVTNRNGKDGHFKGKQYIECHLQLEENQQRVALRPTKEQLTNLMEDIVNRSIIKLVRNHHRIIHDPDINAILYEGAQEPPRDPDPPNTLKAILGAEEKQEAMVGVLTRAITRSYSFLEAFANQLSPLVAQFFTNQGQLTRIPALTSQDFFSIREWVERWRKELAEINKLNEEHESAVFLLNFRNLKQMAIQCANLCLTRVKEIVPRILEQALRREQQELRQSLRLMETAPIGIEVFIAFQHNKASISAKFDRYEDTLAEIGQLIDIMKQLGGTGESTVARSVKQKKQLGEMMKLLRAKIEEAQMHSKVHESYAQEEVRKMIPKIYHSLAALYAKTKQPRLEPVFMAQKISEWEGQFSNIQGQLFKLREYQRFLGMEQLAEDTVNKFAQYFHVYKEIWSFSLAVEDYFSEFMGSHWKTLILDQAKTTLETFLETAQRIKKSLSSGLREDEYQIEYTDENLVSLVVADIKKKLRPVLEAVQCLRDPSLEERELRYVRAQFQRRGHSALSDLLGEQGLVRELVNQGVTEELDFLKKVVFKSKKQLELNSKMAAVNRFWGESVGHSSKSLIDNFAQHYWAIAAEIDEKLTVINCVREDPEVEEGEFRARVENQKALFDALRTVLGEWERHHNYLSYFEPIFLNPYWKGSSEFKAYAYAESNWKKLTKQIGKDFSLRKLASQEKKHLAVLKQNNLIFEQLKQAVQLFLNAKREAFPKLYFIPNQQLLHLLLQDKDYASIDKNLSRIFPSLKSLELNQERNCPLAVRSLTNQSLALRPSPAKQVLQLQQGLRVIEDRMKEAVRSGLLKCSNYYLQDEFSRKTWINENILQVLLFIGNAEFTKLLEYDYLLPEGEDLSQLLAYQMTQIRQLYSLIREQLSASGPRNFKLQVLLMQSGHFRDIIQRLQQLQIHDDLSYEWQRQIRSYYNGGEVAVTRYLTKTVDYGYQFVCPNYSYTLATLSEHQFVALANTVAFQYLPVLHGTSPLVQHFCNSNARNHFAVDLHPDLAPQHLHNLCQGALASSTFLELRQGQYIDSRVAALLATFLNEAKCILDRRESFHLPPTGKNALPVPTFSVAIRLPPNVDPAPLRRTLLLPHRVLQVPEISISAYLECLISLMFDSCESDLAKRVQKSCEIINKCSGYCVLGLQEVRTSAVKSLSPHLADFRAGVAEGLMKEVSAKIVQIQEVKFYEGVIKEVILQQKVEEIQKKGKQERDSTNVPALLLEILAKKTAVVIVGPSYAGKQFSIRQANQAAGVAKGEIFLTDLVTSELLLGRFENGLWRQGFLPRHIKTLSPSQEEWLLLQGQFTPTVSLLLSGILRGELLLANGQLIYLSPNWKFIFSCEVLSLSVDLPSGCPLICSEVFSSSQEQLQVALQTEVAPFFKNNSDAYVLLKNLCVNNFQRVLKFRLKGRFLKPQHLLLNFVRLLRAQLAQTAQKSLQQRGNQQAIEKLFLWSLYWTLSLSLAPDQAKKFESQFFEQVKVEIDRTLPLSLAKLELQSPQGAFRRVEGQIAQLDGLPFLLEQQKAALCAAVGLLLNEGRHVLLTGAHGSGKSSLLRFLREWLGRDGFSFLRIRLHKQLTQQQFTQLLHRKARVILSSSRQKSLSALNGRRLVLVLDDFNCLDESSNVGRFLRSLLALGYYYDPISLEKIYLGNVCLLTAQNASHEFTLSYDMLRHFQPVHLPPLNLRDIAPLYQEYLPAEYAAQITHNLCSLHDFATAGCENVNCYWPVGIDSPLRVLEGLKHYGGKENIVKVWQYLSLKEYVNSHPPCASTAQKILAQVKNYSNLMLKNSQDPPQPVQNADNLLKELARKSGTQIQADYYIYLATLLQFAHPTHLFTIAEPLCPSAKTEQLQILCQMYDLQLVRPYRKMEVVARSGREGKVVVFAAESDEYFGQIVELALERHSGNILFLLDFESEEKWKTTVDQYPAICHAGSRYYRTASPPANPIHSEFEYWNSIFYPLGCTLDNYIRQEVQRIIRRSHDKIAAQTQAEIAKNEQILTAGAGVQSKRLELRKQIEKSQTQLDQLGKEEEQKRKELLTLKNSYESDQSESKKNARITTIQSIELALNDIMNRKRANEDHARSRNEQYNSHHKTSAVLAPLLKQAQQQLATLRLIASQRQKITVFLALTEYFLGKGEHIEAVEKASLNLPIQFASLTQHLFACQAYIHEHSLVLWLLNERTLLLQSDNDNFIQLLQKRWSKTHIITSTKDLEELGQPQAGTAYIIVGELRSEAKFLSDVVASSSQRQRGKNKEESKQQKFVKEVKEERPDYFKQIYIILKEGYEIEQPVSVRSPKEGSFRDQIPFAKRPQRKVTRLNTIRNTLPIPTPKFEQPRSDRTTTTRHQLVAKVKCREMRDGEPIGRSESELLDCLTISIEDQVYQSGGKRITNVLWKGMRTSATFTLLCRKQYPRTQREQVRKHREPVKDSSEGLSEELLQSVKPAETGLLFSLRQELEKLKSKKEMQEKAIIEKIMDGSHRNLAEIGKKQGQFLLNLAQSIKSVEGKIKDVLEAREAPYQSYFSLCVSLWKYSELLSTVYPLFRITKQHIYSLFLSSITMKSTEDEGLEVDSEQSQKQIVKVLMDYVVGCLGYREGLWGLGLMAVVIEVQKGITDKKYIDLFTRILKDNSSSLIIEDHLNKHSCTKQLNKLLESISRTAEHSHPIHAYLLLSLNFDFEQQYQSLKSTALAHKSSFIAISKPTTDAFAEITHEKDCIILKENADYTKSLEIMAERGFCKLVLINFTKEENYLRLNTIIDESPFAGRCQVVLLYTEERIWEECSFKKHISSMRIIQLDAHVTPQQQISAMLTRNFKQIKPELEKTMKLVGYLEVQNYLKELVTAREKGEIAGRASFYGSDFLHSLGTQLVIGDAKKLLEIICETILQGNQKWIIKESRKYLKKQEGDALCRTFLGDATATFDDHSPELAYFMGLDLTDLPQKLTTAQQCQDFLRFILPSQIRKHLKMDIFHLTPPVHLLSSPTVPEKLSIASCWSIIDEIVFENMKNLESIKLKREGDLFKAVLRRDNNRNYLLYRWLQHNVKFLRSLDRYSILSEQTISILRQLACNEPLWGCKSLAQTLTLLQKRIYHIEQLLQNPQPMRKLNMQFWGEVPTIFHLHLYWPRRGDLFKQQLLCHCPSEKDDRGWTIDDVQLVNCSYDVIKGSLQAADRCDTRKLTINLVLGEKEIGVAPLFGLPLMMDGKELFKAEIPTRLREEGCTWREKAVGELSRTVK